MTVRAVRARLTMKVMGLIVMLVLTVVTAHSCGGSGSKSVFNPANVAGTGISAVCANQEATQEASGDGSVDDPDQAPDTLVSPSQASQLGQTNPGGLDALENSMGLGQSSLTCPTTTTDP